MPRDWRNDPDTTRKSKPAHERGVDRSHSKTCPVCGTTYFRKKYEAFATWNSRKACSLACAWAVYRQSPDRFFKKVCKTPTCWMWEGMTDVHGYGVLLWNRKEVRAHRVSYEMHSGEIPDGLVVRHKCDTPACVNPEHLLLGTQAENMHDMKVRGRSTRGERARSAKLTDRKVRAMRNVRRETGATYRALAERYGVSEETARMAVMGRTWAHVKP